MKRKDWHNYYIGIALEVATRGTCDRAYVGAVIVDNEKRLVATGYNGSVGGGLNHCIDDGHTMRDGHCIATVHAEQNAIADCARTGKSTKDTTIYVTHFPCLYCTKLIIASGIKKVCFKTGYRIDDYAYMLLEANGIEILKVDENDSIEVFTYETSTEKSYEENVIK